MENKIEELSRERIYLEEQIKDYSKPLLTMKNLQIIAFFFVAMSTLFSVSIWDDIRFDKSNLLFSIAFGVATTLAMVVVFTVIKIIGRSSLERRLLNHRSQELQSKLEQDFFTNLVRINFNYIDKYYNQTQQQANKSFTLCATAAACSFVMIMAGVAYLSLYPDKAGAGYMSAVAGILGEFISAVLFYFYNKTAAKMDEYHRKLVLTQNIGLALKIAEVLPDEVRPEIQAKLIASLTDNINSHLFGIGGKITQGSELTS